jgi:predicted nucleic acid-binding protein
MTPVVLDASTAVDLITDQGRRSVMALRAVEDREVWAPALIDLEVMNALARMERAGDITPAIGTIVIAEWMRLPVQRYTDVLLVTAVWRLRASIRVADAFYVALAAQLGCPLITSDGRLARAPHPGVSVTLIS